MTETRPGQHETFVAYGLAAGVDRESDVYIELQHQCGCRTRGYFGPDDIARMREQLLVAETQARAVKAGAPLAQGSA